MNDDRREDIGVVVVMVLFIAAWSALRSIKKWSASCATIAVLASTILAITAASVRSAGQEASQRLTPGVIKVTSTLASSRLTQRSLTRSVTIASKSSSFFMG